MVSKPLSYDSLRTVLQYMEANKRIHLVARVPSLRSSDKAIPLKIDFLTYDNNSITINNTEYSVGVYRDYGTQEAPKRIGVYNMIGGCRHDLDQYGFEDEDSLKRPEPGDIVMNVLPVKEIENDDNTMIGYEEQLELLEMEYKEVEKWCVLNSKGEFKDDDSMITYLRFVAEHADQEVYDYHMILQEHKGLDLNTYKLRIQDLREKLEPFRTRRYNTPLPYTPYIQLTVTNACDEHTKEMVKYTQKLHNALRSLVFSRRRHMVQVKTLKVVEDMIIRVPPGLKLKVRDLHVEGDLALACEALKPILDVSRYPLESVLVEYAEHIDFQHETVRTAKKLIIGDNHSYAEDSWLPALLTLQNKNVYKMFDDGKLTREELAILIGSWIIDLREVGTIYTFGCAYSAKLEDSLFSMNLMHKERIVVERTRFVALKMTETSQLQVSYEPSPSHSSRGDWIVKMEVVSSSTKEPV